MKNLFIFSSLIILISCDMVPRITASGTVNIDGLIELRLAGDVNGELCAEVGYEYILNGDNIGTDSQEVCEEVSITDNSFKISLPVSAYFRGDSIKLTRVTNIIYHPNQVDQQLVEFRGRKFREINTYSGTLESFTTELEDQVLVSVSLRLENSQLAQLCDAGDCQEEFRNCIDASAGLAHTDMRNRALGSCIDGYRDTLRAEDCSYMDSRGSSYSDAAIEECVQVAATN